MSSATILEKSFIWGIASRLSDIRFRQSTQRAMSVRAAQGNIDDIRSSQLATYDSGGPPGTLSTMYTANTLALSVLALVYE